MTLLFIHGAGCTSAVFQEQKIAFPDAIAPDLPGRSHLIEDRRSSIAQFGDFIDDYISRNSLSDVVLCGHSMGGAIALENALRKPAWLHAVVLLGSGARLRVAPSIFERLDADFPALAADLATNFYFREPRPAWTQPLIRGMIEDVGREQTARDFQACDAFDVLDAVSQISVPLLALTGDDDKMTPPKYAAALRDRVHGAQARIIPGAGHFVMVERAEETNAAIAAFISGNA